MPIYVYTCASCTLEIEERRPISKADDPIACPICQENCSRSITTFSIGSGRREKDPAATPKRTHRACCPCCSPQPPKKPAVTES